MASRASRRAFQREEQRQPAAASAPANARTYARTLWRPAYVPRTDRVRTGAPPTASGSPGRAGTGRRGTSPVRGAVSASPTRVTRDRQANDHRDGHHDDATRCHNTLTRPAPRPRHRVPAGQRANYYTETRDARGVVVAVAVLTTPSPSGTVTVLPDARPPARVGLPCRTGAAQARFRDAPPAVSALSSDRPAPPPARTPRRTPSPSILTLVVSHLVVAGRTATPAPH